LYICSDFQDFKNTFIGLKNPKYLTISPALPLRKKEILELKDFLLNKEFCCLENSLGNKDDVLSQIHDLFQTDVNKNWLYSYTSKVLLSVKQIEALNKVFLINSFVKKNPRSNLVIFCPDKQINNLLKSIYLGRRKFLKIEPPSWYAWLRFFRTLLRVLFNSRGKVNADTVVFTLSSPTSKQYIDPYYGDLPSISKKDKKSIYIYISSGYKIQLYKSEQIFPLESFAKVSDVLDAWLTSFFEGWRLHLKKNKDSSLFHYEINKFLKASEVRHGDFFYHCFLKASFNRIFQSLSPSSVLYPFENRSWEKLLLRSAYVAGVKNTVGYQHSSITERHLALKILENELDSKDLPFKVITTGQVTYDWLKHNSPAISKKLICGGSLRKVKEKLDLPGHKGILVAISSSTNEAQRILAILNKLANKISIPIIVRSHPTINIEKLFNSMAWNSNVILSKNKKLSEDLFNCHVVLYSSSTVAIEGMLSGRLPIFLDIGDIPSGDPLLGNAIFSTKNENDILKAIKSINSWTNFELKKIQSKSIYFSKSYLKDITPEKFFSLVY
jgi:hypothetical protein